MNEKIGEKKNSSSENTTTITTAVLSDFDVCDETTMQSSSLTEPIDYDNLSIITRPRPPRRRQTGVSLIPFRPYVKCLTSVRQPFSFANGFDPWIVTGKDQIFFTQPNARCIGSLIDDCQISDVIRWDIEGESTRLPMMCKLWIIVDGAVVERGRPHLVQDTAVQVFSAGRNLRSIMSAEERFGSKSFNRPSDRRRRHSWHDVNEYHSVPYYQYTSFNHRSFEGGIQCDIDNQELLSQTEILSDVEEETIDEEKIKHVKKENLHEIIHHGQQQPKDRAQVSITTQTESRLISRSTSIDSQLIHLFNLNLETNEILLSSIANPYLRVNSSSTIANRISFSRHGIEYKHQSVSTGDDYPHWWLRLPTDVILSDLITKHTEEKEKMQPPPSPRHDQSSQTDLDKSRQSSSTRSSRIPKSSSSTMTENHYEFIDGNSKRLLTYSGNSQRVDSHSSDVNQIDRISLPRKMTSSKHSETDYNQFVTTLNEHNHQTYSTPEPHNTQMICRYSSNDIVRPRTTSSSSTSTALLSTILERYEKTLRDRQHAMSIANEQLADVSDLLQRYSGKFESCHATSTINANPTMEVHHHHHHRDRTPLVNQSKDERTSLRITNVIKDKYREMPEITSEQMIQGYVPSPRIHLCDTYLTIPRQREPRFCHSSNIFYRPDYCDLCVTDYHHDSAWIRFNEQRIEELQRRINLMLQIDDDEEVQLLLSTPSVIPTTVTQRIDDALLISPRHRSQLLHRSDRIVSPRRLPYRLHQSVPNSPRVLSRNVTRSTTPVSKSVRISTQSVPPHQTRSRTSTPRPIVSILRRRRSVPATPTINPIVEPAHVWTSQVDGKTYVLDQFSIPRYYRLYNDVSFREMYQFSRILDTYLDQNRIPTKDYSNMVKNYALDQQFPSEITSAA